jgi:hypothetical protein
LGIWFPSVKEETATVQTRGYALYRAPRTQQDWFKAEAFAW